MNSPITFAPKHRTPRFVSVHIGYELRTVLECTVDEDAYDVASKTAETMWANEKTGTYGDGLANTKDDPHFVTRCGMLGEMAFGSAFDKPVDIQYKKGGKPIDFYYNFTVDMKCATRNYDSGLVLAVNENGKKISLKADIYIFGYLFSEDKVNRTSVVHIVGGMRKGNVINYGPVPARKGYHQNYDVPFSATGSIIPFWKNRHRYEG